MLNRKYIILSILTLLLLSSHLSAVTLFVSSDPHYGYTAWTDNEAMNKTAIDDMNSLPGLYMPIEVGGIVEEPEGVLVPGDLTGEGHVRDWNGYWAGTTVDGFADDYGVNCEGRVRYPVYEGYGNHDIHSDSNSGTVLIGIYLRNTARATPINLSDEGLHYSWDWEGIHFVNLNLYAGGQGDARDSLGFLKKDLENHIDTSEQPIILYQHYDMYASDQWWTEEEKQTFYETIKDYNVIAIFVGHSHWATHYKWRGIDTYNAPSVKEEGRYLVVRAEEGELVVCERKPDSWGRCWKKSYKANN